MKKVVVTGASGFLGRHVVKTLASQDVSVRAVTRQANLDIACADVIRVGAYEAEELRRAFVGADAVFHLVAHSHDLTSLDDSAPQRAVTLGGTLAALDAAEATGVSAFIFASSVAVHGPTGTTRTDETQPVRPETPYGRAKLDAESAVVAFAEKTGASAACIRPAVLYGAGARGNVPRMIQAVQKGAFPPIPEFGNRRSMVAVEDVAVVLVQAWHQNIRRGRPFIVTDGNAYSTRAMLDLIRAAVGKPPIGRALPAAALELLARVGDMGGSVLRRRLPFDSSALDRLRGWAWFDDTRARNELGYAPTYNFAGALPEMIRRLNA